MIATWMTRQDFPFKRKLYFNRLVFGQCDLSRSDRVMWRHFLKFLEATILKIGMVKQTFQNVYRITHYFTPLRKQSSFQITSIRTYFLFQVTPWLNYCRLTIDYLTQKAVRDVSFHNFSITETLTLQLRQTTENSDPGHFGPRHFNPISIYVISHPIL